jgi:Sugar (and other) transporter
MRKSSFSAQVSIFEASGSSVQSNVAAIILGVVNIVATINANLCIDRVGRKVLLYISDAGMIASLSVFGAYFYMKDKMEMEAPGIDGGSLTFRL